MADQKITSTKKELTRIKKLAGKYNELALIKSELESYKSDLGNFRQQAEEILEQIKAFQTESQSQTEAVKQIKNDASANKESIIQTKTQAEEHRDNILTLESKVTEQSEKLTVNEQKYAEIIAQVDELKKEVNKQLTVATAGTLAGSFSSRQKDLSFNTRRWLIIFILSAFILVGVGYIVVDKVIHANLLNSPISLVRVLVTVPLFYIVKFCADGYRKERNLEEEYAFKSSVSLSLAGYQKLLKDELPDGSNQQVIDFITRSITSIYTPPRRDENKKSREEKDFLDEVIELIKQIKK